MTELLAAAVLLPLSFFAIKFRLVGLELLKTPICMELGRLGNALRSLCMVLQAQSCIKGTLQHFS